MKPVNEDSACSFVVKFHNTEGQPFTPTSAQWRLRDVSNSKILQDWATLGSLAEEITIPVSATLNVINNDRLPYQEQALAVQVDTGLPTQYSEEIRYKVKNLKGFK